jgi:hypothetical protein
MGLSLSRPSVPLGVGAGGGGLNKPGRVSPRRAPTRSSCVRLARQDQARARHPATAPRWNGPCRQRGQGGALTVHRHCVASLRTERTRVLCRGHGADHDRGGVARLRDAPPDPVRRNRRCLAYPAAMRVRRWRRSGVAVAWRSLLLGPIFRTKTNGPQDVDPQTLNLISTKKVLCVRRVIGIGATAVPRIAARALRRFLQWKTAFAFHVPVP